MENKKVIIEIEHSLTPFYEEVMLKMLAAIVEAENRWWKNKSKKYFNAKII